MLFTGLHHLFSSASETNYRNQPVRYGIYDVLANRGHVCVGLSADTPAFAVASIRAWWARLGCKRYGALTELLILADAGGSNGCRPRLWKRELQAFANYFGLVLTVGHYPTGASKWNPVEHRLFGPPRCRSAAHTQSSSACRNVNSFRYQPGWTPLRRSASC